MTETTLKKQSIESLDDEREPLFQVGLSDLFGLILIISVASAIGVSHWMTGRMYLLSLLYGGFLYLCFFHRSKVQLIWSRIVFTVLLLLISLIFPSLLLILVSFLLAGVMLRWIFPQIESFPRAKITAGVVCTLLPLLVVNFIQPRRLKLLMEARQEFPFVDLSDRLEYERPSSNVSETQESMTLSPAVNSRMSNREIDQVDQYSMRLNALESIHNENYEDFVRAMGFGAVRMVPVSAGRIRTPELVDISFDQTLEDLDEESEAIEWKYHLNHDLETITSGSFQDLHLAGENDFVHLATFGLVDPQKGTAGFLPHAFHFPIGQLKDEDLNFPKWKLDKLELVSLLKFDQPRVYVLDHLPRMDQLSEDNFPTRALDSFESTALQNLKTEKDLVVDENKTQLRMLGSLRAIQSCTDCHAAKRGDLLGAFSYKFSKIQY